MKSRGKTRYQQVLKISECNSITLYRWSHTSGMKAFDNISTHDTEAQCCLDFILWRVGAAISVFPELLPSLPILKIVEGFLFYIVCAKDNRPKNLVYQWIW